MASEFLAALAEATWAITLALLLVLALRHGLRRAFGPVLAYGAWAVVPVAALATLLPAATLDVTAPVLSSPLANLVAIATVPASATAIDFAPWLLAAWCAGAIFHACLLLWRQAAYARRLGSLRVEGAMQVAQSNEGSPAVIGLLRPRIVVPADFRQRYTPVEQELVLAHERLHLQRGDLHANAAWAALQCLFWFNPLVHLGARCARLDQELACDAQVTQAQPQSRKPYAEAMLKTQLATSDLPLGCHWRASHPIKERIMNLNRNAPRTSMRLAGRAFIAALVLGTGVSAWAMQPAQPADQPASTTAPLADPGVIFHIELSENGKLLAQPSVAGRFGDTVSMELEGRLRLSLVAATPSEDGFAETSYQAEVMVAGKPGQRFEQAMRAQLGGTPSFERQVPDGNGLRLVIRPRLVDLATLGQASKR